ncbi:GNAT family N-acetyltransferase [Psychrilyobacter sp.]|uniref:GNAT family N-acetyltransferase n=1 Tax=Psychrilyobacter sp. TaxID=2586924 RepID=UPI003015D9F1
MLKLEKMSESDFNMVKGKMIADYAKDKVKVGHWSESDALELSKEALDEILSDGISTPNHYLLNAYKGEIKVGFVWMNSFNNEMFVNNTCIFEEFQGNEYELEFIKLIENKANELEIKKINIHSYGYNEKNIEVYKKMGYDITDIYLNKGV